MRLGGSFHWEDSEKPLCIEVMDAKVNRLLARNASDRVSLKANSASGIDYNVLHLNFPVRRENSPLIHISVAISLW